MEAPELETAELRWQQSQPVFTKAGSRARANKQSTILPRVSQLLYEFLAYLARLRGGEQRLVLKGEAEL